MTDNISRPYKSTVHLALPSTKHAQYLKDVISVDDEVSNKVVKSFTVVTPQDAGCVDEDNGSDATPYPYDAEDKIALRVLRM